MSGSPYKLAKKESGHSFKCSAFNYKRATMYAYSNSLPTNSPEYWMNDNVYNGAAGLGSLKPHLH